MKAQKREMPAEEFVSREMEKARIQDAGERWQLGFMLRLNSKLRIEAHRRGKLSDADGERARIA